MVYNIIFLDSDRFDDEVWLLRPLVGNVLKFNTYGADGELEYWTIVEILDTTVKVSKT
jgi:hypothetical protein